MMVNVLKICDTKKAAEFLGCSTRRVRVLLAQGRITGKKVGTDWQISYPIQVTFGLRAPLRKFSRQGNKKKTNDNNNESEV
jgi:excisionase family DNA binding protein